MAVRLGLAGRQGAVPVLNGRDLAVYGAAGVSFWPRRASSGRFWAVGIRLDALGLLNTVYDRRAGYTPSQQSKYSLGIDALAELALSVSSAVDIITSLGIEAALGDTDLKVQGLEAPLGTIPALRGVGEVGIRVSF
jgi:hypothetical protein